MLLANDGIGNRFENLVFFKERTEVIAPKSQLNTVFHINIGSSSLSGQVMC